MQRIPFILLVSIIPILFIFEIFQIKILEKNGDIWVYEYDGERCMSFSRPIISHRQTCMDLKNEKKVVFEYQKFALAALYLNPNPNRVLLIGLGGGGLVKALRDILPEVEIDAVELNPKVVEIAAKYFNVSPGDRLKVFQEDGFEFVMRNKEGIYDLIILDAFDGEYIPQQFLTDKFVSSVKRILKKDGIVAVNTFSDSKYLDLENQLYEKNFGDFYNFVSNNRVIIAGKILNIDEIKENSIRFEKIFSELGIDNSQLLEKFQKNLRKKD